MQPRHSRSSTPARPAASGNSNTERPVEKAPQKPAEKPAQRTMEPALTKPAEKPTQKPAEKSAQKPVEFRLNLPGAKSAAVAGTFNGWDLNRTPLTRDPNGGWKTTVLLSPGRYEYRFVIDGAQWFSDPGARESVPNSFGTTNSVVVV